MARPALRLLQYRFDAERRHRGGYVIGLMPHNRNDLARLERLAGAHHVLDECPPAGAVQHFRQRGFQPRALARRQNHNHQVGICHACILIVSQGIDNARETPAVRIEYFIEGTQEGFVKGRIQSAAEAAASDRSWEWPEGASS